MSRPRWFLLAGCLAAAALAVASVRGPAPPARESAAETRFASFYDDVQPFMEGVYAADRGEGPVGVPRIRAVVVPHHLTASPVIATGIRALAFQRPARILLLSPDHFRACPTPLCTVDGVFATPFGDVRPSRETVGTLAGSPLVTVDAALFRKEHGIAAVLPFLAHYAPGVPVTPVVLSQPWKADRAALLALVGGALGDDTALVVSSDFSHYLSLSAADERDERTARTLFAKDLEGIAELENPSQSDCPGCLWLLASLADARGFYEPSVLMHTNSARILGDERATSTTSHFAIAWYESAALDGGDLAAGGDVTVTRGTPPPGAAGDAWWQGDGPRLVNLEGPLAVGCRPAKNPYLFCNELDAWSRLAGIATLWSVENNHMLDRGAAGKRTTLRLLGEAGETAITNEPWQDGRYRVIALTSVINPVPEASAARLGAAQDAVLAALAEPRPDLLTVVYVHGGREFSALSTPEEDGLWERFIDAGADAVVVAHSHLPGDVLLHAGKPIFRGLGNLVFDRQEPAATGAAKMVRLRKQDGRVLFQSRVVPR